MWRVNFCPQCGAHAAGSDRFCGTCGFNLTCVVELVPSPSYDYQCAYQQWVPHNQAAAPVNSDQYQQRYAHDGGGTVSPLSAEISKLLAELFDNRIKHNKA